MIHAIGEAAMQHSLRANYSHEIHDKETAIQKTDQIREKRTIEKPKESPKQQLNLQQEENTTRKNILEDGMIFVEQYDEDGRLIRKIPPGYVPFGEVA
jgi:predicted transposase YbfD/YdcC